MRRFAFLLVTVCLATGQAAAPGNTQARQTFIEKFRAANTTHDGKLTLQQAQAANFTPMVRRFSDIDAQHRGYVTLQDVRTFMQKARPAQGAAQ